MFSSFAKQVGPNPPPADDDFGGLVLGLLTLGVLVISLPMLFHIIGA